MSEHWWTHTEQRSKLESVSIDTLRDLLEAAPPRRDIQEIILHHTWLPTAAQYRGRPTWEGIQGYHMEVRQWSDIGYHAGVAPDGTVWLLRPIMCGGAHTLNHNANSVGLVVLGNYDAGHDDPAQITKAAARVTALLCKRYSLGPQDVYFHRDFANKTCPGTAIDRAAFRAQVAANIVVMPAAGDATRDVLVIEHATGVRLETLKVVPGGDHVADQGKLYVVKQ